MCFIAIVLISVLIGKLEDNNKKLGYLSLTFIFILFLFTIVARLALFLSLIFIFIKIFHHFKLSKTKLLITFCSLIIIISSVFLLNKNLKNRFHIKDSYIETINVLKNQEPRFVIWKCSLNQIYDINFNFFTGYSDRSNIEEKLTSCYGETIENISKRDYYLKTRFNTHNQFFDIFLDGGIIGLSLFLVFLLFPFIYFRNNFEAVFTLLGLITFLGLENLFFRQLGAYLFGILIPLFYNIITHSKNHEIR
jgi:O-antigen ligase